MQNSFLKRVVRSFAEERVRYALCGGYAVTLHGAMRATFDVDFVLSWSEENFQRAERALVSLQLLSKLPVSAVEVFRFREEYLTQRNLIAWSFYNPASPVELVDLILTHNLDDLRAESKLIAGTRISLLSRDALIEMKKSTGRPQDVEDIRALQKLELL